MIQAPSNRQGWWKLFALIALCLGIGAVGGFATVDALKGWYPTLQKPSFNPPSWVFGPVWTVLYILMAVAAYLVLLERPTPNRKTALGLFFLQLVANAIWSPLFFGMHQILPALVDVVLMDVLVFFTLLWFAKVNKTAAWLMVPYQAWILFATALNFAIWRLNV
jgi:translocator protein